MINLPYAFALFVSALISLQVLWIAWQRREAAGAFALTIMAGGMVVWSVTYALMWLTEDAARAIWLDATYFGVLTCVIGFFIFAVQFAQRDAWLTRRRLILLALYAVATLAVLWTDPYHNLFYGGKRTPMTTTIFDGGPWFWVNILFIYALIILADGLIVYAFVKALPYYRQQSGMILVGALLPFAINIISVLKLSPTPDLDLTPIVFSISGVVYAIGLFRFRIFDIVPIARDSLVESMVDAVLVLDLQDRILDLNPAAQRLFNVDARNAIGRPAQTTLTVWSELARHWDNLRAQSEIVLPDAPTRYFDLTTSPVYNKRNKLLGRLVILRDVTAHQHAKDALRRANEILQAQLVEIQSLHAQLREQAIRDSLTGLFNRRYMEETLERELASARRSKNPMSIVMLDIDHFKDLNDDQGHRAGDQVLCGLSELIQVKTRQSDVACRYGGEEFVIILPNVSSDAAFQRAEELRNACAALHIGEPGAERRVTVSFGVATFPTDGTTSDNLLRAVDLALYAAKAAGRNCTRVYSPSMERK
jgi:diguanylate cyclase (GGDEF)-like protein/PAS domain S-box-containing protein